MDIPALRYAVVGAGGISKVHLRAIATQPGVTLVGIADPAAPELWRVPAEFSAAPRFHDAAELFGATQPDLVSVCTPNLFHHEITMLALRQGASVVCEKPMATTVAQAEEMEATRAAKGRFGGVNFSYRNVGSFRFARDLIAAGDLGRLTRVNVVYLQSFLGARMTLHSWRNDVSIAGFGALGDLGVHMIDAVRFISGLDYRRVVGVAQTLIREKPDATGRLLPVTTDTNAAFLAELSGGVIGTFETTQVAPGYGNYFRVELSGENGTLAVHSDHPEEIWLRAGATMTAYATWKTDLPLQKVPTDFLVRAAPPTPGAIVSAMRGENVSYPTFADGLHAQRVLAAITASTETGAWQTLSGP